MRNNLLIVFYGILMIYNTGFSQNDRDAEEAEVINAQKSMVAKLTGKEPISSKKILKSRFTNAERKLTAEYLFDELKELGVKPLRQKYDVQDKSGKTYSGTNIYLKIPATNGSKEFVVLGAHYDTAEDSPGAVHNATGVALVYYVGKKLLQLPARSKNVLIVFWDQQEQSMMGCRMFADMLKKEKKNINSMHRVDFIGWDNDEDRAIELLASNLSLESAYRIESFAPVFKRTVSSPESKVFSQLGYENITVTSELKNGDNSPFIHQTADQYNTVNFKYVASTTEIMYRVLRTLVGQY
ncbi:M28 family peptidase [Aquimarina sp. ERC-38]|uniref:M28 family metallopeptidase n=1 Tax=Aquimarina sp. ERC-38 TaxID=2949996 RepID=UPI0022481A11|nr:M28 family peptidase [Aquimarina sp. ERC-38]UZO79703.1 M28 family peptidase [Aquimarina sp. ERC-38]